MLVKDTVQRRFSALLSSRWLAVTLFSSPQRLIARRTSGEKNCSSRRFSTCSRMSASMLKKRRKREKRRFTQDLRRGPNSRPCRRLDALPAAHLHQDLTVVKHALGGGHHLADVYGLR